MVTINFGRTRVTAEKAPAADMPGAVGKAETIFNARTLVVLGTGVALGVILKQRAEIHTLKRTVNYLQEVIR